MDYKNLTLKFIEKEYSQRNSEKLNIKSYLNTIKGNTKKICIFGGGTIGKFIYSDFRENGINVDFFCDNNADLVGKTIIEDTKSISIKHLIEQKNDTLVIISMSNGFTVYEQLKNLNFCYLDMSIRFQIIYYAKNIHNLSKELFLDNISKIFENISDNISKKIVYKTVLNFISLCNNYLYIPTYDDIYSKDQYFPNDIIDLSYPVNFIDCGAYNGDTLKEFLKRDQNYLLENYYCYEIDKYNYNDLVNNISALDSQIKTKIIPFNLGVSEKNERITYSSNMVTSAISKNGILEGEVVSIDEHLNEKSITFIKMDIEGNELMALKGAKKTIQKEKPILAISVYHDFAHLWEIPKLIKDIFPEYKLYFRHHTITMCDTICYALIN